MNFKRSWRYLDYNSFFKNRFSFIAKSSFIASLLFISKYKDLYNTNNTLYLADNYKLFSLSGFENLSEGEMRTLKYGTGDKDSILIIKYDNKLRALSNWCPHLQAPMDKGVLIDRLLKCPFHGASFDILTGKVDTAPSIDDLDTYEIINENDKLFVKLPSSIRNNGAKIREMAKRDYSNKTKYVILGGGPAGLSGAESLRQGGFTGEILIVSNDKNLPYDRTMISKYLPPSADKLYLRNKDFYSEYGIDIKLQSEAYSIDNQKKVIRLKNGEEINYDKLLFTTGSSANSPDIKGYDKYNKNVYTLRTYEDSAKIINQCKLNNDIVLVGGGFISMEMASHIKKSNKNANVQVVITQKVPFEKELGSEVGKALQKLSEENGIKFITESKAISIEGNELGIANTLRIKNNITGVDSDIKCDAAIFGIGSTPNTHIIKDLVSMEGNHIKSNLFLHTSDPDIYCAGDVVSIPFINSGTRYKTAHYIDAQQQGAISALNMLGNNVPYEYVPFFWTRMWDKSLQHTGTGESHDEVYVIGDTNKYQFYAFYFNNKRCVGFAAMGVSNAANIMCEAFKHNLKISSDSVKSSNDIFNEIKSNLGKFRSKCSRADCCSKKNSIKI